MASVTFDTFSNVVDGKLTQSSSGAVRHSINPSTLEPNPNVPDCTREDVEKAIAAAKQAQEVWAEVPVSKRQDAVLAFADALESSKADFAKMLTIEQGKPLMFAETEIDSGLRWLREQARLPFPEETIEDDQDHTVVTRYTPLGVAVAIVPWNFPVMLACGKIAPALISGNALILKPSPFTPYCGLKLAELAQKFFPPGVFQALSGGDDLGPWLTSHPGVDKISFTGSTATGKRVMESASKTLKRVTLELGGNDPAIICDDVDIAEVAPKIATMAFLNSGQICIAIKRIYVHSSIYQKFLSAMVEFTKSLKVGDGFEKDVFLGPIQNEMQYKRVSAFLAEIESSKLNVAVGGSAAEKGTGYFINPTIIDNPRDDSQIVVEEPFGPVVPLLQWTDEADVIKRANHTDMGLGASVWTKDINKAQRIAAKIKAGSVWVNTHMELQPTAAFGGHKQSGIGAEWGVGGLKSYCNTQTLYLKKSKL